MPKVLKVEIVLTDELLSEVQRMDCNGTREEAENHLKNFVAELNDPEQLMLILENLDYFNY